MVAIDAMLLNQSPSTLHRGNPMFNNTSLTRLLNSVFIGSILTIVILTGISPSVSQANTADDTAIKKITLPASTITLPKSTLPGYNLALQKCTICHSVDYIHHQPPAMDQKAWTSAVLKMQHSYGAPISESDINSIGAYLSVVYGSAKADDPTIINASQIPVSVPPSDEALDVQVLLTNNGCTGCHDINKTIVGPAFKAIAKKYSSDTGAISKLVVSIQNGGTGKWGNMAMPPMNVNNKEAQALAEFILKQ
ncbi:MAG TPA: cytochrome C552 [Colwellia sp.]|nr:cytochrome C552 [Colwellia sp.]